MSGEAVYIATESGATEVDGETLVFKKDITLVREGHPLLDQVPDYFRPVSGKVHYEVVGGEFQEEEELALPTRGKKKQKAEV